MTHETESQMTHETAALIAYGYITQPEPTKAQLATTAAAKAALEQFRRNWRTMPALAR